MAMSSCGGGRNGKSLEMLSQGVSVSNRNDEQEESSKTGGIQEMGNESDKLVVMIKQIEERLSVLEEEDEVLKESIFRSMEERKILMNEILQQFQDIYNHLNGSIIIQGKKPNSSSVQALKVILKFFTFFSVLQFQNKYKMKSSDLYMYICRRKRDTALCKCCGKTQIHRSLSGMQKRSSIKN